MNTTDIPAEYKGYISGNSYYNDHFGFSVELPDGAEEYDVSLFSFDAIPEGAIVYVLADSEAANYLSNGGYIDDNDLEGFVMVVVEVVDE